MGSLTMAQADVVDADSSSKETPPDPAAALENLKRVSRGLEKAASGEPIPSVVASDVVGALKQCTVANQIRNSISPNDSPCTIYQALLKKQYEKSLDFLVKGYSKVQVVVPPSRNYAYGKNDFVVARWIYRTLLDKPKSVTIGDECFFNSLLCVSCIAFRLPLRLQKSVTVALEKILDKYALAVIVNMSEKSLASENAWPVFALSALLVNVFRTANRSNSEVDSKTVAHLWFKAFNAVFLQNKVYVGDGLYKFAKGYEAFLVLDWSTCGETLQTSLRKLFLRTPEVALPLLRVISENTFPSNQQFAHFIGELLTEVVSSNEDRTHDNAAVVLARWLIYMEPKKRSVVFEKFFGKAAVNGCQPSSGKQSKTKNKPEYALALQNYLSSSAIDDKPTLNEFLKFLVEFSEKDLLACKSDLLSQLSLKNLLIAAQLDPLQVKRITEIAVKYAKNPTPNGLSAATAAQILASVDEAHSSVTELLTAAVTKHFALPTVTADYVFNMTLLLLKRAASGQDLSSLVTNVFGHDVFIRDKFVHHLSDLALENSLVFVNNVFDVLAKLSSVDKFNPHSPLLTFVFILCHWHDKKVKRPDTASLIKPLTAIKLPVLNWMLRSLTSNLNNRDLLEVAIKAVDSYDAHNHVEKEQVLQGSAFFKSLPDLVNNKMSSTSPNNLKLEFVKEVVLFANNESYQDISVNETLKKAAVSNSLHEILFKDEVTIFDSFLQYPHEGCRQRALDWLISIECPNPLFRDVCWLKCKQYATDVDIKALNDVEEQEAAIFFTPEGQLYNTKVIDENSDAVLDKQNIRRENKAYKFKDQVAEIELRKELAEKNKLEGKLTPRQQEAVKKELAKELVIRKEMSPLYRTFKPLADLLPVAVRADPSGALKNYALFHDVLIPLLKSYLVKDAAFHCAKTYADVFFQHSSDFLGERALSSLLRSVRAVSNVPKWSWEPYADQVSKLFTGLSLLCMMNNFLEGETALDALEQLQEEEDNEDIYNEGLTLGKLAFVLPVIERVFTDEKLDEKLRREVTHFLKAAFGIDFLTHDERQWPPINLLNGLLLNVMTKCKNLDYFGDVFNLLKNSLSELNESGRESAESTGFVADVISELRNPNEYVREHVALLLAVSKDVILKSFVQTNRKHEIATLLISSHELHENTVHVVEYLCQQLGLDTSVEVHDELVEELEYPYEFWQRGASACLQQLFSKNTIDKLEVLYERLLQVIPAVHDNVGRVVSPARDPWDSRRGLGFLLKEVAEHETYDVKLFDRFLTFLVPRGLADPHPLVRKLMYDAASTIVSHNGAKKVDFVLPLLERLLADVPDTQEGDILRNGLICLMGTLARYLEPGSGKMRAIFNRLIDALNTPSRQVQESVALCLPPLAIPMGDFAVDELHRLLRHLPQTKNFAERCGFAFGVAGLTKGMGLVSLREIKFIETITSLFESKEPHVRESACILFMTMSFVHGKSFDPYVSKILQHLVHAFGDSSDAVREAAREAGAMMMSTVTPAGVKVFLPQILMGLDQEAWRTKCASADFLANISNCAPRQLSESLPKVVPRLATLMTDSHAKVRSSGVSALKQIATVITNPEILAISSHMIAAFVEPAKETTRALQTIVNTKFVHFIDPPALALMMPILKRALIDREPEGRRMAANVVTNVFSIADEKDIAPYMDMLVPNLKHSLLDPSPEVRSAAAQAIGAVVRHNTTGLFTSYTTDLIPWLKEHMMSRSSMVDRLGAAQGLAEVIPAFKNGVEQIMDHAIGFTENAENEAPLRDGYIRLFTYLPSTMGDQFVPYIERVIPSILSALADETEYLRQSALQSGQILIKTYCSQAKRLLLPSLLDGVLNENWRIRHAAVTLIGDFLFNISGISSKMTSDTAVEDDTFGMESVNKTIVKYVGQKSRDKIIVSLYVARFDCAVQVRQAASHVWKLVVPNTPRTVKECLPTLFQLIVHCLATSMEDRRIMGVECLSEVTRKMGDRVMESLVNEVQSTFEESNDELRRGAAEALSIIISCANSEAVEEHSRVFINIFKSALLNSDAGVRQAGADAFAMYYNKVGLTAMEDIVEPMFKQYAETHSEDVLDGIVAILSVNRNGRVLTVPSLINRVLKFPRRTHVLSRLTEVVADTIERSIAEILPHLLNDKNEDENPLELVNECAKIVNCCRTSYTVVAAIKYLCQRAVNGNELAAKLLSELIKATDEDILLEVMNFVVDGVMSVYSSEKKEVVSAGINVMTWMVSQMDPQTVMEIPQHLVQFANKRGEDNAKPLNGFSQPGGWKPFIDMIGVASRAGSLEQRDSTVRAVADLMKLSTKQALIPVAPLAVGTLLRLLADHCPPVLKLHSIRTVHILVEKVPEIMRNFGPQLLGFLLRIIQETAESTTIDTPNLRRVASRAVAMILVTHPRQEAALLDTFKQFTNAHEDVQPTLLDALIEAVEQIGSTVSDNFNTTVDEYVTEHLGENPDKEFITALATLYGSLKKHVRMINQDVSASSNSEIESSFWDQVIKITN